MKTQNTDTSDPNEIIPALCKERDNLIKLLAQSEAHHQRLSKELPLMRIENRRLMAFLQDAAAFLRTDWDRDVKMTTLTHDINGLATDQRCFVPRVTGYAPREQEAA